MSVGVFYSLGNPNNLNCSNNIPIWVLHKNNGFYVIIS
jgi:hypothetical protein